MKKQEKDKRRPAQHSSRPAQNTGKRTGKRKRIQRSSNTPVVPLVTKNPTEGDEEFPGYPHYPVTDDIMNTEQKIGIDMENPEHPLYEKDLEQVPEEMLAEELDATPDIVKGTSGDVTPEEIEELGDKNKDLDEGDDEVFPSDLPEDEMIVPGAELDDDEEALGNEDEENNYYSLGGDNYEN